MSIDDLTPDSPLRDLRDSLAFASQSETHAYMADLYRGAVEDEVRRITIFSRECGLLGQDEKFDFAFADGRLIEYLSVKMELHPSQVRDLSIRQVSTFLSSKDGSKDDESSPDLTYREQCILEAINNKTLTGPKVAEFSGYAYNSRLRECLSGMVKRGLLLKTHHGYRCP